MSVLPKLTYRFRAIPVKILAGYFVVTEKMMLKFAWKFKCFRIVKAILKRAHLEDLHYLI